MKITSIPTTYAALFWSFMIVGPLSGCALEADDSQGIEENEVLVEDVEEASDSLALYGSWVMIDIDFGPCQVLPRTCIVGQEISAHSGPGTAGGCFIYECQ